MKRIVYRNLRAVCAAALVLASATGWSQGIFKGLFGGGRNDEAQQAPPAAEAGDPTGGARPQATPTREQIKKGAAKLAKQLDVERIPSDLFKRYAGNWEGNFYTYSPDGRHNARQAVRVQAEIQSDGSLLCRAMYFDKLAQQFVLGESYLYQKVDAGTVRVTITRASNQTDTQTGHYNDGYLFLQGDISDGVESFREKIDGNRWLVDGFTMYNMGKGKKGSGDLSHHLARLVREK